MTDIIESGKLLSYILVIVVPVVAILLSVLLYQAAVALIRINRILAYVDHVRELMLAFEQWPITLLKML